jgi:capsular exopolysaccharide synthesis family protein
MQREIEDYEKALKELKPKLLPRITDEIQKQVQNNIELAERDLRFKLTTLEKEQEALSAQVEKSRAELQKQSDGAVKLDAIKEDMTHVEDLRKWLAREEEKLDLEIKAAPPRYTVLEEALATRPPESKRRMMLTGGSGLAAFGAVLALFALVEFRSRRIGGPDEMTYGLGLPVVATIPDNSVHGKRRKLSKGTNPLMNEAIDTFRTMLIKAGETETMRVIMITSAQSGEGKTSLSTHLAVSLAQVGFSTLLIDGDLRNPLAHRVFELATKPGLCDLLRGEATIEDLIRPTPIERLWMVTAGEWDNAASRALAREKTRELVAKLRSRFDYVIIDSSPVLPVVDPLLLGTWADGAVISVLREKSRMPLVYAAFQRLSAAGVRVLGTVVNGVHGEQYGAYYTYRAESDEA